MESELKIKISVQRQLIHQLLEDNIENSCRIASLQTELAKANNQHIVDELQRQLNEAKEIIKGGKKENARLLEELNEHKYHKCL